MIESVKMMLLLEFDNESIDKRARKYLESLKTIENSTVNKNKDFVWYIWLFDREKEFQNRLYERLVQIIYDTMMQSDLRKR